MSTDLARDIFGGSESELSSDEEENRKQRHRSQKKSKSRSEGAAEESSEGDSEEDYHDQDGASGPAKRAKAGRKRGPPAGKAQRKRKRQAPTEIDLSELPPEQANKIRRDMEFDAMVKPKKSRPRKKKANEEILDSFADNEVARLRETMNNAAEEDSRANAEKLPALAKLRLLPEAMATLQKYERPALAQSMMDNNLLEAVRRWLEPLPDRSLPALNIQRELFNTIRKMEFIDSSVLKESGLGPLVLFYTKCKRVTPEISRIAKELVSTWSRPIIKRSASYRDRVIPTMASEGDDGAHRNVERLNAILARAKEAERGRVKRNAVMIPQRELGTYTVAPRANAGLALSGRGGASVDEDVERRKKNAERLRMLKSKVSGMK